MAGPYAGLRVLDLSHVIAGPFCARLLADMGAEVIQVEAPGGDLQRRTTPMRFDRDLSSAYAQYANGKRSVGLNLKLPSALDVALRLAEWADVVVENFRPGVLDDLGLGWEVLRARNPRLILCSLTTFGQTGPYAHISGFGLVAEAYSGLMSLTGEDGGSPMHFGTPLADVTSAIHALAAIGAALYSRERTGEGTHVDVSAFEGLHALIDQAHALGAITGGEQRLGKYGRRHATSVPSGVVTTADGGHVAYGMVGDVLWGRMVQAMADVVGLADDPRFADSAGRYEHSAALYDIVEDWAGRFESADALVDHLAGFGISAARVRSVEENLADPHLVERGSLAPVTYEGVGQVLMQTAPYRFSGLEIEPAGPAPHLGQHTEEVLSQVIGLADDEIAHLRDEGALHGDDQQRTVDR